VGFLVRLFTSDKKLEQQLMKLLNDAAPKPIAPSDQAPAQGVEAGADNPSASDGAQVSDRQDIAVPSEEHTDMPQVDNPSTGEVQSGASTDPSKQAPAPASDVADLRTRATAQKKAIENVADQVFTALMGNKDVNSAVDNLYSKLSREGKLAESMEDKEEFRKKFLQNVAHAAVKAQARQISADRSGENVEINFSNFLKPDDPDVRKLVFKGILKNEHLEEGQDAGDGNPHQALNTTLADAFVAIGRSATNQAEVESIRQQIMDTEMHRVFIFMDPPKFMDSPHFIAFPSQWNKGRLDGVIRLSSNEIVSKEDAFELLKTKVVAAIPDILDAPSELSASSVPEALVAETDGDGVVSRFARTVARTPFEGFSVAENVTEAKANEVLLLLRDTYAFLREIAKKTAELEGTEKFSIVLGSHQIFTEADANQLREIKNSTQ
jgi:hypothetical protein